MSGTGDERSAIAPGQQGATSQGPSRDNETRQPPLILEQDDPQQFGTSDREQEEQTGMFSVGLLSRVRSRFERSNSAVPTRADARSSGRDYRSRGTIGLASPTYNRH